MNNNSGKYKIIEMELWDKDAIDPLIAQQIPAGRRMERDIHPEICASEQNQAATAGSVGTNVPIYFTHRRNLRCDHVRIALNKAKGHELSRRNRAIYRTQLGSPGFAIRCQLTRGLGLL